MRVLAAEDNPVFQTMLRNLLRHWGYDPVVVDNGADAWKVLAADDPPRLVTLDWMMPGMDGVELCRKLRTERPLPYIYVVMLTARTQASDLIQAMEAGCDDYLTKPFAAPELRVRLRAGARVLGAIAGEPPTAPLPSTPQYPSCFLSHSTKDGEFVGTLFVALDAERVPCWYAPEDLKIGSDLRETFDTVIKKSDRLLLVLSENSIRSPWVQREVERALDEEQRRKLDARADWRVLFPIRLDDSIFELDPGWATDVKRLHIGDFRSWKNPDSYKRALQRLLKDLKA